VADARLPGSRVADRHVVDLQHLGSALLVVTNGFSHLERLLSEKAEF
jgi:hypothetical protein